ncbi:hypothetical protein [Streptomyces cyanogenus]|uniref:Fatty-acid peroxygenase n=1 Tax=Streptomyces cyanogenus TaxID=80860 RepID=A0ABX7U5F2_STRCY|nr:Fatty-acid peroxygenase [Streptomyces cyanogenus]
MVDGFATAGPRHWRPWRARGRQEARLARLTRLGRTSGPARSRRPPDSVLDQVCRYRGGTGEPLVARTAAVELLSVVRPTVAVCWFVAFAAHALHRWSENRERLRSRDAVYAAAFTHEVRSRRGQARGVPAVRGEHAVQRGARVDAMDWTNVDWPVVHPAAIAWQAVKKGEPLTVLSLEPELYAVTGITPLNPT